MDWRRTGDISLSDPVMDLFIDALCLTRLRGVIPTNALTTCNTSGWLCTLLLRFLTLYCGITPVELVNTFGNYSIIRSATEPMKQAWRLCVFKWHQSTVNHWPLVVLFCVPKLYQHWFWYLLDIRKVLVLTYLKLIPVVIEKIGQELGVTPIIKLRLKMAHSELQLSTGLRVNITNTTQLYGHVLWVALHNRPW